MRRYAAAYGLWLLGVISAAAVAYYYYRSYVLPLGEQELARHLPPSPLRSQPSDDPPAAAGAPSEED